MTSRFWLVLLSAIAMMAFDMPARAAGSVCEAPTFRVPPTTPFTLTPATGVQSLPKALVAGNFFKKSGADAGCACDLAVTLNADSSGGGYVALLRGNEDGSFAQEIALPIAGEFLVAIVKARFKQDDTAGLDTVAVATLKEDAPDEPGRVRVFAPDANGKYAEVSASWAADEVPVAMTVGDFNGDERSDIAVANRAKRRLTILLGQGDGFFADPLTVELGANKPNSLAAGRFSGGPGDEIAVGTDSPDATDPASGRAAVVIVRREASGAFAVAPPTFLGEKNSFAPWVVTAKLAPQAGAPRRDLAVAFVDRDSAGEPLARVEVLLGKDGSDFTPAQVHDLGAAIIRSAAVADLDGDGVDDLAVSTFGETSVANGAVHLFQGKTGTDTGFHVNPNWIANLNLEGFRPESLAFGQFGPVIEGPNGARSKLGLAFVNDPNSVAVFLSNGQGAFVQPTVVTTRLPKTAHLFLAGDFHSSSGADALQDLAFVSTDQTGSDTLNFLMSNHAGGFADPVAELARNVGIGPHIGLVGQFDDSPPNDIVMIETPIDVVAQAPLGTLFRGKGEGRFSEFTILLDEGDRPVAMTAGQFSDQASNAPLDIAIADKSGKITLLKNNGEGKFLRADRRFSNVPFTPAALAPSDNLRGDGRSDLVVRDSTSGTVTLLKNLGPVEQGESQFKDGGSFEAAGAPKNLLVGSIPGNDTADQLDHIVTYEVGAIRAFRANAQGFFDPPRDSMPNMGSFSIQPPYAIADFGNGKPALAVAATDSEALGIVQLKGDGAGGYTFATGHMTDATPRGELITAGEETDFVQDASSAVGSKSERTVIAAIAGSFRSALHGNNKPDVAFVTRLNTTSVEQEVCPNDFEPQPPPPVVTPRTVCPMVEDPSEPGCDGPTPFAHCFSTDCCHCRDLSVPVGHRCPNSCNVPQPPPPPPPEPICTRTQAFAPVITVFANTCGD